MYRAACLLVAAAIACGPRGQTGSTAPRGDADYRQVVSRPDIRGRAIAESAEVKATLVVVFASWCGACRRELAVLQRLSAERPGLRVIGVNAYEEFDDLSDEKRLDAYLTEHHPWLTVVRADAALLRSLGGVARIPSIFVYDERGARVKVYLRTEREPPGVDELARLIDPLLG